MEGGVSWPPAGEPGNRRGFPFQLYGDSGTTAGLGLQWPGPSHSPAPRGSPRRPPGSRKASGSRSSQQPRRGATRQTAARLSPSSPAHGSLNPVAVQGRGIALWCPQRDRRAARKCESAEHAPLPVDTDHAHVFPWKPAGTRRVSEGRCVCVAGTLDWSLRTRPDGGWCRGSPGGPWRHLPWSSEGPGQECPMGSQPEPPPSPIPRN